MIIIFLIKDSSRNAKRKKMYK